jgi:DNA-binding transcriptional MocR family regulator
MSPATVMHAYGLLEDRGLIATRPRSGYYVNALLRASARAGCDASIATHNRRRRERACLRGSGSDAGSTARSPGFSFREPLLFPLTKLGRLLGAAARRFDPWLTVESLPLGSNELRRQIARHYLESGVTLSAEDIVITTGALEALNLCLQRAASPATADQATHRQTCSPEQQLQWLWIALAQPRRG